MPLRPVRSREPRSAAPRRLDRIPESAPDVSTPQNRNDFIRLSSRNSRDEKQLNLAEQVETAAFLTCGDGPVRREDFRRIFDAKGVCDKMFRLIDVAGGGAVVVEQVMEFIGDLTCARPRAGFDKCSLEALECLFRQTVGDRKEISRDDFQKICQSKNVSRLGIFCN